MRVFLSEGASLLQTVTGSIPPRFTLNSSFFLPTGCTIRSLVSGLRSGGCKGSKNKKKWALSHWIMPLFQLLWPGMPNFTARYSSLCVNQSFARGRGVHRPPPFDLTRPLIPHKPVHTCCLRVREPGPLSNFDRHLVFFRS